MKIQRTILWVVLFLSLFLVWNNWQRYSIENAPAPQKSELADKPADKKAGDQPAESLHESQGNATAQQSEPQTADAASQEAAQPAEVPSEKIKIKTNLLEVTFDTKGAQLVGAVIIDRRNKDIKPYNLLENGERFYTAQSGLLPESGSNSTFPNQNSAFKLVSDKTTLQGPGELPVVFESESDGIKLTRTYVFHQDSFRIDVTDKVENVSGSPQSVSAYYQISRDNHEPLAAAGVDNSFHGFAMYSDEGRFQKVSFGDIEKKDAKYVKDAKDGWISFIDHFFVTAWVPQGGLERHIQMRKLNNNGHYAISATESLGTIESGQSTTAKATMWVGPKEQAGLAQVDESLPYVVDYTWLHFLAKPMFLFMSWIHSWIGNWGWTIIVLTIIIKICLYPLARSSYRSMARMKKFAPRMKEIKEKYGDDKQQMNQAMMNLYRTEKINPLGGCLPMLLQIPIFLTLYRVIWSSVELRGAPWLGWIQDLAAPDPYYVLPILMIITMYIQFSLNPPPPDPTQAKVMKFMPLIFGVISIVMSFPAGLVLYWTVNNILSFMQQKWISYNLDKAANDKNIAKS